MMHPLREKFRVSGPRKPIFCYLLFPLIISIYFFLSQTPSSYLMDKGMERKVVLLYAKLLLRDRKFFFLCNFLFCFFYDYLLINLSCTSSFIFVASGCWCSDYFFLLSGVERNRRTKRREKKRKEGEEGEEEGKLKRERSGDGYGEGEASVLLSWFLLPCFLLRLHRYSVIMFETRTHLLILMSPKLLKIPFWFS